MSQIRIGVIYLLLLFPCAAHGAAVAVTELGDSIIDSRGMTLGGNVAEYGTAINGESFETNTITTYGGYEYTAYWVMDTSSGTAYHVAVARRQDNGTTFGAWQVCDLAGAQFVNGMSGGTPSDAHNVVSLGIDQANGTIFLAYDMHDNALKFMQTGAGAAASASWSNSSASLFGSQTSSLGSTSLGGSSLTYPMFVQTPSGNEQLFIRQGASGGGSWFLFNYAASSSSWGSGHQIDNGFAGAYQGNTQRNAYPNGFSYNGQGQLMETFVWRETASSSNHDVNYVYSNDGGATWMNNSGLVVSSTTGNPSLTFSLTSAGLVVASISQSSSLMNQQCQASDNNGNIHCIDYSLDPSKSPTTGGAVWDPAACTYYQYWRDSLGNWCRDKIPGGISTITSTRPKLFFDGNDNAIAIYCTNNGPGGALVIAEASAATNWTDWQTVYTTSGTAGGYFSEAQADASELAAKGILSVVMQDNPASSAAASAIHSLDFSIALTPAGTTAFTAASGNWSSPGNWSGGAVPAGNTTAIITGGGTANYSQLATSLSGDVAIGSGGGNGTLNISGGSLLVVNTISVGRDGGAVGIYNQTSGSVSSSRFVVGDFYSTSSGGGASIATISGGSLTTSELQVAVSDGTTSSGSSFVVASSAVVNDTGDAIVADCGNTGSLIVNGGSLSISGNIMPGLNGNSNTVVKLNGGAMSVGGNSIAATNLVVSAGTLSAPAATLIVANNAGQNATASISGGAVAANSLFLGNTANAGALFQSGGTVSITLPASVNDFAVGSGASGTGYYKLSGGVLNTNEIDVGGNASNTTGVVEVTGGTLNDTGWITIGRGSGASSGVLNVTGGTIYFGMANAAQPLSLGWAGTGSQAVLNVGGGIGGASVIGPSNSSTSGNYGLNMNDSTNLPAILTVANLLSGGTLTVNQVASSHSTATSLLNFNGGTLKATATNAGASFLNATSGPDTIKGVYIYPGGATIDDSGTAITIANALLAPTGSGVSTIAVANGGSGYIGAPMVMITGGSGTGGATAMANMASDGSGQGTYKVASITITNPGVYTAPPTTVALSGGGAVTSASGFTISTAANAGGGLTKDGSGKLTLSGSNSYSGGTTVQSGLLKMANAAALGTGGLDVAGGTLDLAGFSPTVAGLGGAAGIVTSSTTGRVTLVIGLSAGARSAFGGTLQNGGAALGLTVSGSGVQVLAGNNTYTGVTDDASGELVLDSPGAIRSGNSLIVGASAGAVGLSLPLAEQSEIGLPASGVAEQSSAGLPASGATSVPEAGTLLLLVVAAGTVWVFRRRKRYVAILPLRCFWLLIAVGLVLGTRHAEADGPTLLHYLHACGIGDEAFAKFADDREIAADELDVIRRIALRLRDCPADRLEQLMLQEAPAPGHDRQQLPAPGSPLPASTRGRVFVVQGSLASVEPVEDRDSEPLWRCSVTLTPSAGFPPASTGFPHHALAYVADLPEKLRNKVAGERVALRGVFVKYVPGAAGEPTVVLVAPRLQWRGEPPLGNFDMDFGLLEGISDNSPLTAADRDAFYRLLQLARKADAASLGHDAQRLDAASSGLLALFRDSASQRGRLVRISGTALRVVRVPIDDPAIVSRLGADHYFEIDLVAEGSQNNPLVFCTLDLPEGMPLSATASYGEDVEVTGFFLKNWQYPTPLSAQEKAANPGASQALQSAPLVIGPAPLWKPAAGEKKSSHGAAIFGLLALATIGACLLLWQIRQADREFSRQVIAPE